METTFLNTRRAAIRQIRFGRIRVTLQRVLGGVKEATDRPRHDGAFVSAFDRGAVIAEGGEHVLDPAKVVGLQWKPVQREQLALDSIARASIERRVRLRRTIRGKQVFG